MVDYQIRDGVAVIKFNNQKDKVNSLGEQVEEEIRQITNEVFNNSSISGIVIMSGKPDNFIVGADIRMLEKVKTAQEGATISRGEPATINSATALTHVQHAQRAKR